MRFSVQNELNMVSMGDSQTAARVTGASMIQTYPVLASKAKGYGNVTNVGISGDTTTAMLARFSADVLAHRAGAVSIMGFLNDMTSNISGGVWVGGGISVATTKANVKSMVQQAQAQRCRVTLLTACPALYEPYLSNAAAYVTAFSQVQSETGCEYIDVYTALMALSPEARNALYIAAELPNAEHPNASGHAFIAGLATGNQFGQFTP